MPSCFGRFAMNSRVTQLRQGQARPLESGGCFVVEVIVPQLRRVPPGVVARVFTLKPDHVGLETIDDLVGQVARSHHWMLVNGRAVRHSAPTATCGGPQSSTCWRASAAQPEGPLRVVGPAALRLGK